MSQESVQQQKEPAEAPAQRGHPAQTTILRPFARTAKSGWSSDGGKSRPVPPGLSALMALPPPPNRKSSDLGEPDLGDALHSVPWARASTALGRVGIFAGLTVRSLGVIYGDIGTSPLYVFSTLFPNPPADSNDFIAACSLIIWSLFILVTLKYVVFILIADNRNEGGIFALGGLLIGPKSRLPRWATLVVTVVMLAGAGLVLGDGAFTPAVSVLGAVEGLSVAYAGVSTYVVAISLAILIALFLAQPFGTSKIGLLFGPIMLVWFSALFVIGMWRITQHPECLRAFDPFEGLRYVFANPNGNRGYTSLAAIFLSITGLEALYADMGHFTAWPVRVGWICVALPALVVQYLGQTALLLGDPTLVSNPFYNAPPSWAYWPMLVLATMAATIASQCI